MSMHVILENLAKTSQRLPKTDFGEVLQTI